MSKTYSGGCACNAVRYDIAAEPVAMVDCQCGQCQRDSGTGHGSYVTFAGIEMPAMGEIRCFEITGDGGTVKSRAFCPVCGTQLFIGFPSMPGVYAVRAGTLDDPSVYKAQFVTWTDTAQPWDLVDPAIPKFARMPT